MIQTMWRSVFEFSLGLWSIQVVVLDGQSFGRGIRCLQVVVISHITSHLRDLLLSCHVETKHPQITTHLCLSIVKTRCTKMAAAVVDHSRHGAPLPAPMHRNRNISQHAMPMPQGYVDITRLLSVLAGGENSHSKGFLASKTSSSQTSPTVMDAFAPPAVTWFCWRNIPHPREPRWKVLAKAAVEGINFLAVSLYLYWL
jgi:hypothetical protein